MPCLKGLIQPWYRYLICVSFVAYVLYSGHVISMRYRHLSPQFPQWDQNHKSIWATPDEPGGWLLGFDDTVDTGGCILRDDLRRRTIRAEMKPLFHRKLLCLHLIPVWHTPYTHIVYDRGDSQWNAFRVGIPELGGFLLAFVGFSHVIRRLCRSLNWDESRGRIWYYAVLGVGFLVYLHAMNTIITLGLLLFHFLLAHFAAGTRHGCALLWAVHLFLLLAIQFGAHHRLGVLFGDSPMEWSSAYPLLMLRILSFSLDLHSFRLLPTDCGTTFTTSTTNTATPVSATASTAIATSSLNGKEDISTSLASPLHTSSALSSSASSSSFVPSASLSPATHLSDELSYRVKEPATPLQYQNFVLFLAYVTYAPLYLSGPTLTYNAFASFIRRPSRDVDVHALLKYVFRFVMCLAMMELGGTYFSAFGITRHRRMTTKDGVTVWEHIFEGESIFTMLCFSYLLLKFVWLKFLLIWRFARMFTLLDGLDCAENMDRCMSHHHSIRGFWRSWHASFNLWLVRYIYIPLGGRNMSIARQAVNIFCVFTFVAIWHEASLQLLSWGWLLVIFMLPEITCARFAKSPGARAFASRYPLAWARLEGVAGACMIVMLKVACLVGFGWDLDGLSTITAQFGHISAWAQLCGYIAIMYVGTRMMMRFDESQAVSNKRTS